MPILFNGFSKDTISTLTNSFFPSPRNQADNRVLSHHCRFGLSEYLLIQGIRTAHPVSHFLFRARSVLQELITDKVTTAVRLWSD